jgi:hypothetical protein
VRASIARERARSQRIEGEKPDTPEELLRWMGAIQAQDYRQALWAIGLRLNSGTAGTVERAIAEGKILRTWPMRGTLHFVASEDAAWMLKLSAPKLLGSDGLRLRRLELDEATVGRCGEILRSALEGGKRLPRDEMMRLLEASGIATTGQRGYHILWRLSLVGLLCVGPMEGKRQSFALLDEWAPRSRSLSREEGVALLASRYFAGHGPATIRDFGHWAGLALAESRGAVAALGSSLIRETMNGKEYWSSGGSPHPSPRGAARVRLLPGFDEYILGYEDRSEVLAPEHAGRIVPGSNGRFLPCVLVDGQVVGTWRSELKKDGFKLRLEPFAKLAASAEAVAEAAKRYGDFLGLPPTPD